MRALAALVLALTGACQDYNVSRIVRGDAFTQATPEQPIDLLWVVDNSGTMSEEQEALAENFTSFARVLFQTSVDFRLGVTTTDLDATAGALVGEVLTRDTEDLEEAFASQAEVGVTGSRDEAPLEAMRLATSEPLRSEANAELFRDDAILQVIVVTDEDDQSGDSVDTYVAELAAWKGEENAHISAIAGGLPEGCASLSSSAEAATRLLEAVEATNGTFKSICSEDFGSLMKSLAFGSTGMTDTFVLSALPALESMEVTVDGVLIHRRPHDGWQYDAAENAVILDGYAVPRPGQVVRMDYYEISGDDETEAS